MYNYADVFRCNIKYKNIHEIFDLTTLHYVSFHLSFVKMWGNIAYMIVTTLLSWLI